MINFEKAVANVLDSEGGYDNDPDDTGGETVQGVSRNNFPNWEGWTIVDTLKVANKSVKSLQEAIKGHKELQELIKKWYKTEFWDKVKGDQIVDYKVALAIFDFAVNAGHYQAVKTAQRIVKTVADGVLGNITLTYINAYDATQFCREYANARKAFYEDIVAKRPTNAKFLNGWKARAERLA